VFEDKFGRNFLNLGNKLSAIFGQSTIVGNLSSALHQTAPKNKTVVKITKKCLTFRKSVV
ncbi:hypothetical protein, partial [Ruminococcus sp.]|uniref:hypothetical protein n=1 Tax=Ruminococcus sp. TaxID=41978 RepID=UPI003AF62427